MRRGPLRLSIEPLERTSLPYHFTILLLHSPAPWHFLNFFPEPQGLGSLRPTFALERTTCWTGACSAPPPAILACWSSRFFLRWNSCSISSTEVETPRGGRPLPPPSGRRESGAPPSGEPVPGGACGRSMICMR